MSKKQINVGLKLKDMHISLDSTVIRKALPKDRRQWPGIKKGTGGLPGGGPVGASGGAGDGAGASESLSFARSLLQLVEEAPPLENITAEKPPVKQDAQDPSAIPDAPTDGAPDAAPTDGEPSLDGVPEEPTTRYVKNAHLIFKKAVETGQFEELWIYPIDRQNMEKQGGNQLKAILAGTDIKDNQTQSEDGSQSYSLWTAGNAQYVHIKGLPN